MGPRSTAERRRTSGEALCGIPVTADVRCSLLWSCCDAFRGGWWMADDAGAAIFVCIKFTLLDRLEPVENRAGGLTFLC